MNCRSCFAPIDKRSVKQCDECKSPIHKECAVNYDGATLCDVCFVVASETPKSKFGEFELPQEIRRTHIETYRSCPYKFFKEVIEGNEQPPNEYTQVGSDLHELFEEYILHGKHQSPDAMKKAFTTEYWETYTDELFTFKSRAEMWERAMHSIDTFFLAYPLIKGDVFRVEEKIYFNIGENLPQATITMDLITEVDGELDMHDWKTGRVMVGQKLSTDLQAPLYIYAVREKYGKPVRSFTFYYLNENKTRVFTRSETDPNVYICMVGKREYKINVLDAIREVQSIFSRIKKGDFNIPQDTRKMHFTCKMCHLQAQGLCAGADEQSWQNLAR